MDGQRPYRLLPVRCAGSVLVITPPGITEVSALRSRLRRVLAVFFGLALVSSLAVGAVMMQNPRVDTVQEASGEFVGEAEGQVAAGAMFAIGIAGYWAYSEYIQESPSTSDLAKADAIETKKEIYDQAAIQAQNTDNTVTAYSNYLNDTASIALMEGKNAYIRALENGSAEAIARTAATEAVSDYYSTKQTNLKAAWNTTVTVANSARSTASNTTGVSSDYVYPDVYVDPPYTSISINSWKDPVNRSVQLVNGSDTTVKSPSMSLSISGDGSYSDVNSHYTPNGGWIQYTPEGGINGYDVQPPTESYSVLNMSLSGIVSSWSEIQEQNTEVQAQLDTFVNNTYDSYQSGDINTSDLVDPYLGAREYAPENATQFQSWSLRSLSAMGLNTPENLSNIGRMNVTANGEVYTGILMSDENPADGFTVGETYNASELDGSQFVALDSGGAAELTGEFTLGSATTAGGEQIAENESVTYRNVSYETADTEEFQDLQNELDNLTEQINQRQQTLRAGAGGSGGIDSKVLVAVVVLAAAVAYMSRED